MKRIYLISGLVAAVFIAAVVVFFQGFSGRTSQPAVTENPSRTAVTANTDKAIITNTAKTVSQAAPPEAPEKIALGATPADGQLPDIAKEVEDNYSIEMENIFIEEAMDSMPALIELEVHEPGVIFFRNQPQPGEDLEAAMAQLAEKYKHRLRYNKPVNVVFFISGRPMKAKVFFRE